MIVHIDIYTENRSRPYYAIERDFHGVEREVQRYPTEKRTEAREIKIRDAEHCDERCPQFEYSETWRLYVCHLTGYVNPLNGKKRAWKCKEAETGSDARKGN